MQHPRPCHCVNIFSVFYADVLYLVIGFLFCFVLFCGRALIGGQWPFFFSGKINLKLLMKACTFLELQRPGVHEAIIVQGNVFLFHGYLNNLH